MRVIHNPTEYSGERSVLALGNFDGVHIGHAALIRRAVEIAEEHAARSVICTFDRHPLEVLRPGQAPVLLTTMEERLRKFAALGADWAFVRQFTISLSETPPEEYLKALVLGFNAMGVVVGENHRFGKGGRGDALLIETMARQLGFQAEIVPPVYDGEDVISSTLVRRLLARGDRERAMRLLGNSGKRLT